MTALVECIIPFAFQARMLTTLRTMEPLLIHNPRSKTDLFFTQRKEINSLLPLAFPK